MSEAEVKACGLTPREKEIMGLVADGLTDREIATALGISEQTVKNHLKDIHPSLCQESCTRGLHYVLLEWKYVSGRFPSAEQDSGNLSPYPERGCNISPHSSEYCEKLE